MSFRKLFKRNNNIDKGIEKKGIKKLLDKEGFYVIMFICVCIVGVTAAWVAKSNIDRLAEEQAPQNEEMEIVESEIVDVNEGEVDKESAGIIIVDEDYESQQSSILENYEPEGFSISNEGPGEIDSIEEKLDPNESLQHDDGKVLVRDEESESKNDITQLARNEEGNDEEVIETSGEEVMTMIWPVRGELGMGYAVETLILSETLQHYTTHHGIDIIAEKNTPVKAALAGEVVEILTDSRLGLTIAINHGDGLITRYSNLCTDAMVNVGDKVTQGETISGVGTSSIFASAEPPHLHFEILVNGENVDPMKHLSDN